MAKLKSSSLSRRDLFSCELQGRNVHRVGSGKGFRVPLNPRICGTKREGGIIHLVWLCARSWDMGCSLPYLVLRTAVTAKNDFMECYRSIWASDLFLGQFWDVTFFCEDADFKLIDIKWLIVLSYYFKMFLLILEGEKEKHQHRLAASRRPPAGD